MKTQIYLFPGLMTNERLWSNLIPLFDDSYELIHIPIPQRKSLDEIIDDLAKTFKGKKINLLGFSLGGYIATSFTLKYPNLVKKLFVVSSSVSSLSKEELTKREDAISFVNTYGFKGLSKKKVISLVDAENKDNESLITLIQEMYVDLGKDVFISQFSATLKRENISTIINSLDIPITFYYSKNDRLINHSSLNTLLNINKKIKFIELSGTSHMLPLEHPLSLSKEIKKWINSNK
jgi:pimeloyl-ACP methyl ester carboxylesterase